MPQQINLCTPILLAPRRYFSAHAMVWALGVWVLLGGALCAFWVWSLSSSSEEYKRTLGLYAKERESLQAALKAHQASIGPAEANLTQELQSLQAQLEQRERMLGELRRGLLREGHGHSARLRLVAQTIPAQVWVTEVLADENQMEVRGYTLEPAALNGWVARLAIDPVLHGQTLSAVKVERVNPEASKALASVAQQQPTWAFTLVSAASMPAAAVPGARP